MTRECHASFTWTCDTCNPIRTEHVYPPIPIRMFDWSAVRDNYEPGCLIGNGRTEIEAIASLREQEEDRCDD